MVEVQVIDGDGKVQSRQLNDYAKVAPNELMLNFVFNREIKKLLDNDNALFDLYKAMLSKHKVTDWSKHATY